MARIRSIKPEFWTSEQVMALKPVTRLLFIGMWNFADDFGRMPYAPGTIKAQVMPGDDVSTSDVRDMVTELSSAGLIIIYSVKGKDYLEVTGWCHQKIDRPHKPKYPAPYSENTETIDEPSPNPPRTFDEPSSLDSREDRKGEDRKKEGASAPTKSVAKDRRRATRWPEDLTPDRESQKAAELTEIEGAREFQKFRNHALEKGRTCLDWRAAERNWYLKAAEFMGRRAKPPPSGPVIPDENAVEFFKKFGRWHRDYGPEPGSPGCRAPAELLEKYGYRKDAA